MSKYKVDQTVELAQAETKNKIEEIEQNKALALMSLLNSVTDIINQSNNINDCISLALQYICHYADWPIGHAYIVNIEDDVLTARSCHCWFTSSSIDVNNIAEFKKYQKIHNLLKVKD